MSLRKTMPLDARYQHYIDSQKRELAALEKLDMEKVPMRKGRYGALKDIVSDLHLYLATFPDKDDKRRVHALLVTIQSKIGTIQDTYKETKEPNERLMMVGAYNEYKRQLEQIRNLLTPMKEGK